MRRSSADSAQNKANQEIVGYLSVEHPTGHIFRFTESPPLSVHHLPFLLLCKFTAIRLAQGVCANWTLTFDGYIDSPSLDRRMVEMTWGLTIDKQIHYPSCRHQSGSVIWYDESLKPVLMLLSIFAFQQVENKRRLDDEDTIPLPRKMRVFIEIIPINIRHSESWMLSGRLQDSREDAYMYIKIFSNQSVLLFSPPGFWILFLLVLLRRFFRKGKHLESPWNRTNWKNYHSRSWLENDDDVKQFSIYPFSFCGREYFSNLNYNCFRVSIRMLGWDWCFLKCNKH